jgi:dihydroorotate dehydrogenase
VIGAPPLGSAFLPDSKQVVTGPLYGPALHSLVLHDLRRFHHLNLPRLAVGGIHSIADVKAYFEAGATAVQLDTVLFIDPNQAEAIARAFVEFSH